MPPRPRSPHQCGALPPGRAARMILALGAAALIAGAAPGLHDGHHGEARQGSPSRLAAAILAGTMTLPLESPVERAGPDARLGEGEFVFAPVPGWCRLPDERPMGNTHGGIVVDAAGRVYYNTDTDRAIMVHEADGTFVRAMSPRFAGLHSMMLRTEDGQQYIYAAHLAGKQAVKLRLDGTLVWAIGVPMESGRYDDDPNAFNPTAVAVGPDGRIYVADGYGRNWIHVFGPDLRWQSCFGGTGREPGRFQTCHGMALDERGDRPLLLVCDRENRRLQRFDLDGAFVDVVATDLRRPCSLAFHGDAVAVAELEGRVTILGPDFGVRAHVGDNPIREQWAVNGVPPEAWKDGVFIAPHAVCFDAAGNLLVMDWNASGRISKLARQR